VSITLAEAPRSRVPAVFAVLGILAALIVGGTVYYTQFYKVASGDTPEQVVGKFLTAVFADKPDNAQVGALVCDNWDPAAAVQKTRGNIRANAHVSWQDIIRLSTGEGRVVVEATITVTPIGDEDPSTSKGWAFDVVDERGWRVCEARPIV
jgi:hypothetical protein